MENIVSLHYLAICKIGHLYYWVVAERTTDDIIKKSKNGFDNIESVESALDSSRPEIELDHPGIKEEKNVQLFIKAEVQSAIDY